MHASNGRWRDEPIFVAAATIPRFQKIETDSLKGWIASHVVGWSLIIFALELPAFFGHLDGISPLPLP